MRYPLVDGQGNSVRSMATLLQAMRYTEIAWPRVAK